MTREPKYKEEELSNFASDLESLNVRLAQLKSPKDKHDLLTRLLDRSSVAADISSIFKAITPKNILVPGSKPQNKGKYKDIALHPAEELQPVYVHASMSKANEKFRHLWDLAIKTAVIRVQNEVTAGGSGSQLMNLFSEDVIRCHFRR